MIGLMGLCIAQAVGWILRAMHDAMNPHHDAYTLASAKVLASLNEREWAYMLQYQGSPTMGDVKRAKIHARNHK